MCTNCRYIYNRYIRKTILVPCGKCEACQQDKANKRAQRIRNNVQNGTLTLFTTFTYANDYLPYILRSDLKSDSFDIPVYRNADIRYIFNPHTNKYALKKDAGIRQIHQVFIPLENRTNSEIFPLVGARGLGYDKIGVCLHSDFQKFLKRLRQYFDRVLKHEINFSYFVCSEYGSRFKRPHFHALFFIPAAVEQDFRNALVACWSYADKSRTKDYMEIARDAASYVASYVNSTSLLSQVMQTNDFRQKHSFSLGFGVAADCFSLPAILRKIDSGDLCYYSRKQFDGESSLVALPIPSYVLNRFFPKFKGFSILPTSALSRILRNPQAAFELSDKGYVNSFAPHYDFNNRECYEIAVRLENAFQRFYDITGLNRFDYEYYYQRAWLVHFNVCNKLLYKDIKTASDLYDFYENIQDIKEGLVNTDFDITDCQSNPNARSDIVIRTNHLTELYYLKDKSRKVTNYIMTEIGHMV